MENIGVVLTSSVYSYLEEQLDKHFNLIRLWNLPQKDAFFKKHSGFIRAIVTGYPNVIIDRKFIDSLPALEIVSSFSVGVNHVDLAYCKEKGIRVTNTESTKDVADLAIGLILATLRGICESERYVKGGLWKNREFILSTKVRFPHLLELCSYLEYTIVKHNGHILDFR